jgi:hypothetical protein
MKKKTPEGSAQEEPKRHIAWGALPDSPPDSPNNMEMNLQQGALHRVEESIAADQEDIEATLTDSDDEGGEEYVPLQSILKKAIPEATAQEERAERNIRWADEMPTPLNNNLERGLQQGNLHMIEEALATMDQEDIVTTLTARDDEGEECIYLQYFLIEINHKALNGKYNSDAFQRILIKLIELDLVSVLLAHSLAVKINSIIHPQLRQDFNSLTNIVDEPTKAQTLAAQEEILIRSIKSSNLTTINAYLKNMDEEILKSFLPYYRDENHCIHKLFKLLNKTTIENRNTTDFKEILAKLIEANKTMIRIIIDSICDNIRDDTYIILQLHSLPNEPTEASIEDQLKDSIARGDSSRTAAIIRDEANQEIVTRVFTEKRETDDNDMASSIFTLESRSDNNIWIFRFFSIMYKKASEGIYDTIMDEEVTLKLFEIDTINTIHIFYQADPTTILYFRGGFDYLHNNFRKILKDWKKTQNIDSDDSDSDDSDTDVDTDVDTEVDEPLPFAMNEPSTTHHGVLPEVIEEEKSQIANSESQSEDDSLTSPALKQFYKWLAKLPDWIKSIILESTIAQRLIASEKESALIYQLKNTEDEFNKAPEQDKSRNYHKSVDEFRNRPEIKYIEYHPIDTTMASHEAVDFVGYQKLLF